MATCRWPKRWWASSDGCYPVAVAFSVRMRVSLVLLHTPQSFASSWGLLRWTLMRALICSTHNPKTPTKSPIQTPCPQSVSPFFSRAWRPSGAQVLAAVFWYIQQRDSSKLRQFLQHFIIYFLLLLPRLPFCFSGCYLVPLQGVSKMFVLSIYATKK